MATQRHDISDDLSRIHHKVIAVGEHDRQNGCVRLFFTDGDFLEIDLQSAPHTAYPQLVITYDQGSFDRS